MNLNNINFQLRPSYDSRINNIVTEFFIPMLENSTSYSRICGLFSSTSLALAARGIQELVKNDGKMRLVVSPILTKEDADVLQNSSQSETEHIVHESFVKHFDLKNEFEKNHVGALGYLLKKGLLEIRVDIPTDSEGHIKDAETIVKNNILDEKIGIFQDRNGNAVSFRGSVNENQDSWERGIFSITVDRSWNDGQKLHVNEDIKKFERLWIKSTTLALPKNTKKIMIENSSSISEIDLNKYNVPEWAMLPNGRVLWNHQIGAINSWISSNYKMIFSIATSGGKTLSALVCSKLAPLESIVLIVVPRKVLIKQWEKEIREFILNVDLIICDSEHKNWNEILPGKLSKYITNNNIRSDKQLLVLATMDTASSAKFLSNFEHIDEKYLMLIADEAHHLGAPTYNNIFTINARRRLALSATFQREWDEIGTNKILEYFGEPLEESYTVADGIREKRLSEYEYFPIFAYMNANESDEYSKISIEIKQLFHRINNDKDKVKDKKLEKRYELLLMKRAKLLKKAEDKPRAYSEILRKLPKKPFIVFGDDNEQLQIIKKIHRATIDEINQENETNEPNDILIFHAELDDAAREIILNESRQFKIPVFGMNCLDEGVDVPEFQSAILVSSSTSKRQYIQRRGRILRISKKNSIAQLYDIVVLPNPTIYDINPDIVEQVISKEKERINILASDAINHWEAIQTIDRKLKEIGIY